MHVLSKKPKRKKVFVYLVALNCIFLGFGFRVMSVRLWAGT